MYFHPFPHSPSSTSIFLIAGFGGGAGAGGGYNVIGMKNPGEERIYTVAEANRLADNRLQGPPLWVEGEVGNLRPYPNYSFFSLSDPEASLSCIIFADAMREAACELREGMGVLARGRLGVYVRRGQYRLNVVEVLESGEGHLRRDFLLLMRKLSGEGLFAEEVKRPLPAYAETVGLITSLRGAAVRDVVTNCTRRFAASRLVVRGVRVQGEEAAGSVVEAIELFNRAFPVDVLILARGGGSAEDLQAFNREEVVRAIRASSIPVVTGVGHELDITLADLAADFRASTPTGAAEAVVPDASQVLSLLREREVSLAAALRRRLHHLERGLGGLEKRRCFTDPAALVGQAMQRLADGEERLLAAVLQAVQAGERGVATVALSLARYPHMYRELPHRIESAADKLAAAAGAFLRLRGMEPEGQWRELRSRALAMRAREEGRLRAAASRLEALSPLAVLARGYAIATRAGEARPLTDGAEVSEGEMVDVRLHRGALRCEVLGVEHGREGDGGGAGE